MAGKDDWSEYQKLVLSELERLDKNVEALDLKVDKIQLEIGLLKYKSSLWGGLAGGIPVIVLVLIKFLSG